MGVSDAVLRRLFRGRPHVHRGFFKLWTTNDLNKKVMPLAGCLRTLLPVAQACKPGCFAV